MILIDVFSQESEILLIKFQIPVVFWARRKSCDAKPGLGLRLAYQSLASRITPALNSLHNHTLSYWTNVHLVCNITEQRTVCLPVVSSVPSVKISFVKLDI
jgi:hypothetical protein